MTERMLTAQTEWERAYDACMQWRDWQGCELLLEERESADWWLNRERGDDK